MPLLVVALLLMTAAPIVVYYTVKLATFAFYRARHQAERYNKRESHNGLE